MTELRVGIAGLGRLGRVHAANLAHKIPGAILTAACVPGADSQAYARQELGLEKVYGDFREMVADPELDAVAIVSPSGEHCWQIEAALDAGKHVFSEKPLGVTMEQCLQAEAAVARHPELVCMLGFMRRYDKSYAYAKEKIAAGAIGTPYLVKSTGIDPEAVVEGAIRYSGTSGGIFLDSAIHDIDLIAKIENRSGVDKIDEIIDASDGIMVARGDLGVEIPFEELPAIQKRLITRCRRRGKRVITATEMLESMIHNPRPTRAEISDVANAVYDGTSALMLSGETAAGEYPVESVAAMARIAAQTENDINYKKRFQGEELAIKNDADAISHATCALSMDVAASLIVVCTRSGQTARMVSRFRPPVFIIGMTTDVGVWHKLALSWGVLPVLSEEFTSSDVMFYHALLAAKKSGLTKPGDRVVITGGVINGKSGNTNQIKLETI